jgi:hypothetical protein
VRRSAWPNYIYILTVILAVALGLLLAGAGSITVQDQAQLRLNQAAPTPHGDTVIGQTFIAGHNGLSAVEVLAVVYPDTPLSLQMQLVDAQGRQLASAAFAKVKHNAPVRLSFRPQPTSAGQTYTLRLSGPADNAMTVWAYGLDGYDRGTLLVNDVPTAGDLRFSTTYTYLWLEAVRDAVAGLGRLAVLAIPLWLILFGPGLLLLSVVARGADWVAPAGVRWGLALALSLSLLPLSWLWLTVSGNRWSPGLMWAIYAAVGVWNVREWFVRWRARPFTWPRSVPSADLWLGLIVMATLVTRLCAARDLAFPAWVDSSHHYLITAVMAQSGQVPANYYPLLSVDQFTYHFGFHALAVTVHWLTSLSLVDTFLLIGQLLQGLMPLSMYAAAVLLTRRRGVGLWAAFIVGLVSFFPGYYLTWGRYTQLLGLLLLAPALGLTWRMVAPPQRLGPGVTPLRPALGLALVVGLLMAGIVLAHYRVLAFSSIFVLAALAAGARGGWKRAGVAAVVAGGLTAPWLARLVVQAVLPLLSSPSNAAASGGYNDFPWFYFKSTLERGWFGVAIAAAVWGAAWRKRVLWALAGWVVVASALLNIGPGTWLVNNNSWAISLFVPGAIAAGWGARGWWAIAKAWARRGPFRGRRLLGLGMAALLAGAAAYAGLRGGRAQIGIVNATTVLATANDKVALDWLEQNTPPEAVFAINGWLWLGNTWAGADGGSWIWPLTGRRTTLPPLDYTSMKDEGAAVNDFNIRGSKIKDWTTPEARALLREAGVTHVFIGERGGYLKPELFMDKPGYSLVYSNGADWVFELK